MRAVKPFEEYEELTREIAVALADHFGDATQRCERDVKLQGRATRHQVDVLWEGTIDGEFRRLIFECKHYTRAVDQGLLLGFHGTLGDVADDVRTDGVFVTTKGYQVGARAVAETYGIKVVELREPTAKDTAGRVTAIDFEIKMRVPVAEDYQVQVHPTADVPDGGTVALWSDAPLLFPDGTEVPLNEFVLMGEVGLPGAEPAPMHAVMKPVPSGTRLRAGEPDRDLLVTAVGARVGEQEVVVSNRVGPGGDGIAHVLRDALDDATVWFARDGKIYTTSGNGHWLERSGREAISPSRATASRSRFSST